MGHDWHKATHFTAAQKELMSRFRISLWNSTGTRFIGIDDLCGCLISRDPLPPGAVFEGIVVYIEEPIESLMSGGALEIIIRKRTKNTLTAREQDGTEKEDQVPQGDVEEAPGVQG